MINVNSDEAQKDLVNSSGIQEHEIYKYVARPIPLIPKNKYTDDLPRSYFEML